MAPRVRRVAVWSTGGIGSIAIRAINAIPYVVDAPPGLLSSVDLPLTIPHGALA